MRRRKPCRAKETLSECLAGETADLTVESFVLSRIVPEGTQCTIAKQDAITDYFLMTQIHCSGDSFAYGEIVINGGPESLNAYADLSMGPDANEGPAASSPSASSARVTVPPRKSGTEGDAETATFPGPLADNAGPGADRPMKIEFSPEPLSASSGPSRPSGKPLSTPPPLPAEPIAGKT